MPNFSIDRIDKVKAAKDKFFKQRQGGMLTHEDYRRFVLEFFNDAENAEIILTIIKYAKRKNIDLNTWRTFRELFDLMADSEWICMWNSDSLMMGRDIDSVIGRML